MVIFIVCRWVVVPVFPIPAFYIGLLASLRDAAIVYQALDAVRICRLSHAPGGEAVLYDSYVGGSTRTATNGGPPQESGRRVVESHRSPQQAEQVHIAPCARARS